MDGGLAEYSVVEASQIIPLPDNVSFAEAAAMPVAYGTAYRMIVGKSAVKAGDKVLVLGASGGVGTASVLLGQAARRLRRCRGWLGRKRVRSSSNTVRTITSTIVRSGSINGPARMLGKPSRNSTETGFDVVINNTGGDTWHPTLKSTKLGGTILVCRSHRWLRSRRKTFATSGPSS